MFCPKCGNQLPDDSQYCNYCGSQIVTFAVGANTSEATTQALGSVESAMQANTAPLPCVEPATKSYTSSAPVSPAPTNYATTQAVPMAPMAPLKAKKRSRLPLVLLLVVILLLTMFAYPTIRNFLGTYDTSTPTGAVEKATSAALDLNFDRMLDTIPPELLDYNLSLAGYSNEQELVAYLNNSVDALNNQTQELGFDARSLLKLIDIQTGDVSYYSEDGLASLRNEWNSRIPGFGDTFENAATVTVGFSGQLDVFGQSISLADYIGTATQNVTTVQIDGQWYLLEGDISQLISYF